MVTLYYKFNDFVFHFRVMVHFLLTALLIVSIFVPLRAYANDVDIDVLPRSAQGKISISQLSDIQLVSETASIPLTINNELAKDVVLKLDVISDDTNRLEIWSDEPVTIKAHSEQIVSVPVRAKANGNASVTAHLYSQNLDFGTIAFTVHITRAIGTAMTVFFFALLGSLTILGTWRTIRLHRRKAQAEGTRAVG
jgi:hypothetical protein